MPPYLIRGAQKFPSSLHLRRSMLMPFKAWTTEAGKQLEVRRSDSKLKCPWSPLGSDIQVNRVLRVVGNCRVHAQPKRAVAPPVLLILSVHKCQVCWKFGLKKFNIFKNVGNYLVFLKKLCNEFYIWKARFALWVTGLSPLDRILLFLFFIYFTF